MSNVVPMAGEREVDVAWKAFDDHAKRGLIEHHLLDDPEWQAERQRLHAAFYAVFTGEPVEMGNVIYARFG